MLSKDAISLFLDYEGAKGLAKETTRWYNGILNAFAKDNPNLPEIPEPIYKFLSECAAGDERRHGYYRALKALYNFLDLRLHAFPNPMKFVQPPRRQKKQPHPLTIEQLQKLLNHEHPPKIKAALLFLADTGARMGELANLNLKDISDTPWGYIARITGKTGTRLVPMGYETYHALMLNLPMGYTKFRLRRLIAKAFVAAGVPGTAHTLRHTFATLWQGDELILQQIMGHAHLSTTRIYRQLRTSNLSLQHRQFSTVHQVLTKSGDLL